MERDFLARFYMLSSLLAGIAGNYAEEFIMLDNDKLRGYSISLVGEIDELLNNGKTKEEIITIIQENDFLAKDPELTKDEGEYLRHYCLKLLDIRYKLFIERKSKNLVDLDDDYVVIEDDGYVVIEDDCVVIEDEKTYTKKKKSNDNQSLL